MTKEQVLKTFEKYGLFYGRIIESSKSGYVSSHPNDKVIFNANVITKSHGKIWYGDLNVTLDEETLIKIKEEIGEELYILYEYGGRFENENLPTEELIKKAAHKI